MCFPSSHFSFLTSLNTQNKRFEFSIEFNINFSAKGPYESYSYFRENCAVSSVPEPILSSSLQMSVNDSCLAIVNQLNLEVNSTQMTQHCMVCLGCVQCCILGVLSRCLQGYRSHRGHGESIFYMNG